MTDAYEAWEAWCDAMMSVGYADERDPDAIIAEYQDAEEERRLRLGDMLSRDDALS
jgi:hypothetical protein